MHLNTLKFGILAAALTIGGTAFAQGSDSCATAQVLPGDGSHAFDNNGATTGVEGQGCTTINSDVWFEWTASTAGTATLSTCGGSSLDTKVAAYAYSGGCPLPGEVAIVCNDDSCGLQSEVSFAVTSGTTYLLQIGSYSSSTQGSGTFSISAVPPICSLPDDDLTTGDNDDCASALPLPLGFSSGLQVHGAANAGGADDDFWSYSLQPGDRLDVSINFDGSVGNIDLVAWDATAGCPGALIVASAVNPSDSESVSIDNLGAVAIDVVIQVNANGILFDCNDYSMDAGVGPIPCMTDDSFEDNDDCASAALAPAGLSTGLWVYSSDHSGGEDWDFYRVTVADGETLDVNIYFSDATADTDLFLYDAASPACGSGVLGDMLDYGYSTSDDENASWTNSTGASVDVIIQVDIFEGLSAEPCNTYDLEISGGSSVLGTPFCFGDGSDGLVCPCGNVATVGSGEGCKHSAGVGSFLTAAGSPTVGADTLILTINQGEPNEACIFMSNNSLGAAPFIAFDGAICLGVDANLTRHFTNPATGVPIPTILDAAGNGTNVMPLSLSDFNGLTVPGATMHYQAWMRSPSGPCASGAQFSAGISILWN